MQRLRQAGLLQLLQIVESRRAGHQVRLSRCDLRRLIGLRRRMNHGLSQRVIATLGRYEELQASGQLERLLQSGARLPPRCCGHASTPILSLNKAIGKPNCADISAQERTAAMDR
jgi:hypothetical protein